MKIIYLLFFSLIISGSLLAQMPMGNRAGGQSMNLGHFYGKVVDSKNKPMESASVQLTQNRMDTVTKTRRDFVIAAMLTDKKGDFSIDNLPIFGNFQILITAVGFTPYNEKISFNLKMNGDKSQMMNAVDKDLGYLMTRNNWKEL
jgi:hypothetical protein